MTLKELVEGKVQFLRYRDGDLWYRTAPGGFEFPVPVSETGTATFNTEDRAILFMTWIKRQLGVIEAERARLAEEREFRDSGRC